MCNPGMWGRPSGAAEQATGGSVGPFGPSARIKSASACPSNLKLIASGGAVHEFKAFQSHLVAEKSHLEVKMMCNPGGIWNFERLKLNVGGIRFPRLRATSSLKQRLHRSRYPRSDRTVMDAFEPSDRTPAGVAAQRPNRLDALIAGRLASGLALHRTPSGIAGDHGEPRSGDRQNKACRSRSDPVRRPR